MQATGPQPHRSSDGTPIHYEIHRPERTALDRLVQLHAHTCFAHVGVATGAGLLQFIKDEFDAFLERGVLAHGSLGLCCRDCGHDKLAAFSYKRRGFVPRAAQRMAQMAALLIDHAIPHAPVRPWALALPIPLRLLLAAQPKLMPSVLQVVHRVIPRFLLDQAGLKAGQADGGRRLV